MIKHIYVAKVNGAWGGFIINKRIKTIINAPKDVSLIDFHEYLKESYPDYRVRCVKNEGIENEIRKHQDIHIPAGHKTNKQNQL